MQLTILSLVLLSTSCSPTIAEDDWTVASWSKAPESVALARASEVWSKVRTMGRFPELKKDYEAAYAEWRAKPSNPERFLKAAAYHYVVQEFAFPTSEAQSREILARTPKFYGGFRWLSRTGQLTRGAARLGYLVCVSHVGSPNWGKLRSRLMVGASFDPDLWLRAIDGPISDVADAKKALGWADRILSFEPKNARYLLARSIACESLHTRAPSQIRMIDVISAYSAFVKAIDADCTEYMRRYTQSHLAQLKSMVPPPAEHQDWVRVWRSSASTATLGDGGGGLNLRRS